MVHGENRIPYWIDRRLTGLAGPDYGATISFGLPIEPEDSQYGKYRVTPVSPSIPTVHSDSLVKGGAKVEHVGGSTSDLWRLKSVPSAAVHRLDSEPMDGGMDVSRDVYLRVHREVVVEGMSIREASRVLGVHRDTVRKMVAYSVPPGYRRHSPPRRPKLDAFTGSSAR